MEEGGETDEMDQTEGERGRENDKCRVTRDFNWFYNVYRGIPLA